MYTRYWSPNSSSIFCSSLFIRIYSTFLDTSHIVLGTDLGAAPRLMASLVLSDLKSFDGFDEDDLRTIARAGAIDLFPRLASV